MKIDAVFSGGGVKAYAFVGAYRVLEKKGYSMERLAGTSAGAIFASLIAAGYTSREVAGLLDRLDTEKLLDPSCCSRFPIMKWLMFYFQKGLYKGNKLEAWVQQVLANKGIYTFGDLPKDKLKIVVSDISLGRLVVLPDDLERIYHMDPSRFSVAAAVRMSAGFPYFFMPKEMRRTKHQKSYIVDGGLLSNFPLWIFRGKEMDTRPVLGVTLREDVEHGDPFPIKNGIDMLHALFLTMQRAHDTRYIQKSKEKNVIFIPVKEVAATDVHLSEEKKEALIELGTEKANSFLKQWP